MLHFLGMRATLVALLACIFAHLSNAQVILLSENRSVSASGWAQGEGAGLQSYSFIQTPSASFADFNGSVSGSADSTDVIPPDLGYGNLTLFPHHAKSQSNQTSTISPSAIAVSGSLLADEGGFAFGGGGSSLSLARSVFEVGFRVDAPIAYTLSAAPLLGFHQDSGGDGASSLFDFSLTSASHGVILNYYDFLGASLFGDSSGILQPDDYILRLDVLAFTDPDPIGDFAAAEYSVSLTTTTVPESASTGLLLGLALAGLVAMRRRFAHLRR